MRLKKPLKTKMTSIRR